MSRGKIRVPTTADHAHPALPKEALCRPAFVAAFPRPAGLPVVVGEPLGRQWIEEGGLDDPEISGAHIEVRKERAGFQVRDLGSRNGTWVDGRPQAPNRWVSLRDGSVVRVGSTLLVFHEALEGAFAPADDLDAIVAPFGLRPLARGLAAMREHTPRTVLLRGETGSGKELLARAVSKMLRPSRPYVAVNVAGIAAGVFESQLFGHVAGAFSGAGQASKGLIASHDGGTIFLDEIGELSADLQAKLLRLLDNREVLPVGADKPRVVDVLVIAATHAPLDDMVERGTFRRDLLARLSLHTLELPPLRARREDIFFVARRIAREAGLDLVEGACEVEAVERLLLERWPTNVRGLAAALCRVKILDAEPGLRAWAVAEVLGPLRPAPEEGIDEATVLEALEACEGNETRAAEMLGITRGKLRRLRAKR